MEKSSAADAIILSAEATRRVGGYLVSRDLNSEYGSCRHQTPHSPTPVRILTASGAAGAKAISLQ